MFSVRKAHIPFSITEVAKLGKGSELYSGNRKGKLQDLSLKKRKIGLYQTHQCPTKYY